MSYHGDVLSRIKQDYSKLSTSEQFIADLVLTELNFVAYASITQIAQRAKVSEATVIRFSKAIGCNGVRHLKECLIRTLAIGERFILNQPKYDELSSTVTTIFNDISIALNNVMQQIDIQQVQQAAQLINQAKQVIVFGTGGGSTTVSQDAQYRLFRFDIPITAYHDTLLQCMAASALNEQSVLLVFSASGCVNHLIDNVKIARQYGANVISITPSKTPLADCSDITLHVKAEETDLIFKPSASRYALLAMLDVLCFEVALLRTDQAKELLRRIKFNLDCDRQDGNRHPIGD